MTKITYKTIIAKAKEIRQNVDKNQELGVASIWSYYIAKTILNHKRDVEKVNVQPAVKSNGDYLSRQIYYTSYKDMAERLCGYVENNKEHRLPNYISYKTFKVKVSLYTLMFADILISYEKNGELPDKININSKDFVKETEPSNEVLAYFQKKTGLKLKYIDDFCDYIKAHYNYEFYFDDRKSNKQVIDSRAGNCTDLSQLAVNIAEGLGYEWKAIHTRCNRSGTGHIYPMFRKKGVNGGDWFIRDVACISDENRYCVWCKVGDGGSLIATNPQWFLQNKNR